MTVGASSVLTGSADGSGTWLPEPLASQSAMSAAALRREELDPPRRTSVRAWGGGAGRCEPVDPAAGGAPSGLAGPAAAGWLAAEGRVGSGCGFDIPVAPRQRGRRPRGGRCVLRPSWPPGLSRGSGGLPLPALNCLQDIRLGATGG